MSAVRPDSQGRLEKNDHCGVSLHARRIGGDMRPLKSLQSAFGLGALAAPIVVAIGLTLPLVVQRWALATDRTTLVLLAFACGAVGLGVGLALRRSVLGLFDRMAREQRAESLRFNTAIDNISQGLCFFDGQQRLIVCNRRYAQMYGLSDDDVRPGTTLRAIVDARFAVGSFPAMQRETYLAWRETIAVSDEASDTELALSNGKIFAIHHEPMPDGGWVATHEDVTERRQAIAQIERMAHQDGLTGLPNRVRFRDRLNSAIGTAGRGDAIAVLCIDLDRFKVVNDTLGHPVGDDLLRAVAQRLQDCVRQDDLLARLGGDEFAIIQTAALQPGAAHSLAARLVGVMERPFDVRGHRIDVGASVGIAQWPRDGADSDQILSHADLALYAAKSAGRGDYRFFEAHMSEKANSRRTMEIDLRNAASLGQFTLHYQPIVSLAGGPAARRVLCCEALIRWDHPTLGLLLPDAFVGLAEETGLIGAIGEWVLDRATLDAARWPSDIGVCVNLSPAQMKTGRLVAAVRSALASSGLSPHRLALEIAESEPLSTIPGHATMLHALRALGVRITLDDFGAGRSSLGDLRSFRFDAIKIDRSFVADVVVRQEARAVVRAMATLGVSCGMHVAADGVENEAQRALLVELGCDQAQGDLFGRPVPLHDVAAMLRIDRRLALVG